MSVKILECDVKSQTNKQTNKQTNNKSEEKKETKDKNDKHPFQIVGQRSIYVRRYHFGKQGVQFMVEYTT